MELEKSLKQSLEWMNEHNIDSYYGSVFRKRNTEVSLDSEEMSLPIFFEFLQKMKISTVFIYKSIFVVEDLVEDIDMENITNAGQINQLVDGLRRFDKQLDLVAFNCIKDNIIYNYLLGADWVNEVEQVENQIKEILESKQEEEENNRFKDVLSSEETDKVIVSLVTHKNYFRIRRASAKVMELLSKVLKNHGFKGVNYFERDKIKHLANTYFEDNLLDNKEKELRSEIAKMKQEKLPKVEMSAKLNISMNMLNNYYY